MALIMQKWLLKQLNADDALDAVKVMVKFAVRQFGAKRVARELRKLADFLDTRGAVSGWNFPQQPGTLQKTSNRSHLSM